MLIDSNHFQFDNLPSIQFCDKKPVVQPQQTVMEEDERSRYEQLRSWHDEAYLYINQAITQEKPSIDRKDVALMMYQRGLGLLDQALCVDTEVRIIHHQ